MELRQWALDALCTPDPGEKAGVVAAVRAASATLSIASEAPPNTAPVPGRPARPQLIHPAQVPRRSPFKPQGLAAPLHAIAHIEFNAIKNAACSIPSRHGQFRLHGLAA
jgi:uncharacterized ferritin-like protein (DUF455 family)